MNTLQHIVFVIDGNRRWAKVKGKPAFFGHRAGGKRVEDTVEWCLKRRIPHITFWVLSTENLKERSREELAFLFQMIGEIPKKIIKMDKEGVRFQTIGDLSKLPKGCQKSLIDSTKKTEKNTIITVTLAVNYGGHDELIRAFQKIVKDKIPAEKITEDLFSSYLDTKGMPDPDLIVRTGGKKRLSGLFPWQGTYSELYFSDIMWPDFSEEELDKALAYYQAVGRNFGK